MYKRSNIKLVNIQILIPGVNQIIYIFSQVLTRSFLITKYHKNDNFCYYTADSNRHPDRYCFRHARDWWRYHPGPRPCNSDGIQSTSGTGHQSCHDAAPIGLIAAYNYYKAGYVNIKFALILATAFILGSYFGSKLAISMPQALLKKSSPLFLLQ